MSGLSTRHLVAGVDSSTQSCKVVIVDPETGEIVRQGRAKHPDGTSVNPDHWWDALLQAIEAAGGLSDVKAISIAGQQHGMVALNAQGQVVREVHRRLRSLLSILGQVGWRKIPDRFQ